MISKDFSLRYEFLKKVHFHHFFEFLKKQKVLIFMCDLSILLMYGLKLLNYVYGIDSELYMGDKKYINWIEIGRFGLVGLQKLFWQGTFFNPYTAIFFSLLFLLLSDILFCYIFYVFSNGSIRTILFYVFSFFYLSSGTWCEQLYFTCQCTECIFIVCLIPIAVYFLFYGLLFDKKLLAFVSVIITILITSVYQAVLPLYAAVILSCFMLLRDTDSFKECDLKIENQWLFICVKILIILIISVSFYFILNKLILFFTRHNESDYLYSMVGDGGSSYSPFVLFLIHIYELTIGNIPFVQNICSPIFANHANSGVKAVAAINQNTFWARWIYIPISLFFISLLIKNSKKRYTYILSGVGLFVCIFALSLVGSVTSRTEYALAFTVPFMAIYCVDKIKTKYLKVFCIFILFSESFYAIQKVSNITYFDKLRFDAEKQLSIELDKDIKKYMLENNVDINTPVIFYGNFIVPVSENFFKTKTLGYGAFSYPNPEKISNRPNAFMRTLNMVYSYTDSSILQEKAINLAQTEMDCYPVGGSIKYYGDFVLVKLSE